MTGDESGCHLRSQATAGRPQGGAARCCVPAFAAFAAEMPEHARTRQDTPGMVCAAPRRPTGRSAQRPAPSLTQTIGLHLGWATSCLEVSRPKSGFATHQKVKMRIAVPTRHGSPPHTSGETRQRAKQKPAHHHTRQPRNSSSPHTREAKKPAGKLQHIPAQQPRCLNQPRPPSHSGHPDRDCGQLAPSGHAAWQCG